MDGNKKLIDLVALANEYCELCNSADNFTKEELTDHFLNILPRLYWHFFDLSGSVVSLDDFGYFSTYVDEDLYESVRTRIAAVYAEDDSYLETFMEDMKYSDSPIGAAISEGLADIYQPLFDFVSITRDSEGAQINEAFMKCEEDFQNYWSQNLCNVMRALNNIKYPSV